MTCSGCSVSANEVKPRRSLNMTVASPRTPPSRTPSASCSTWSTTDSGTKRANASRVFARSNATVRAWIEAVAAIAMIAASAGRPTARITSWSNATCAATRNPASSAPAMPRAHPVGIRSASIGAAVAIRMSSSTSIHHATGPSGKPRSAVAIAFAQISGPGISPEPVVDVWCRS